MPELPDLELYREAITHRMVMRVLTSIRMHSPFLLRTVEPPLADCAGRRIVAIRRLGKRLVLQLEGERFLILHLMVAGRLQWKPAGGKVPGKVGLAAFDTDAGTLVLTEAGSKRRASLHLVVGEEALAAFDRGGLEPLRCTAADFMARLRLENHTLKRALTDPRLFSGIGNAYSDEILHHAGLSPLQLTRRLDDADAARLHASTVDILTTWVERLRVETGARFPGTVTAFRPEMAVHGKFGQPCPVCGTRVQRIRYAENETNYCARCQTGGRLLADRALSRLLKDDWPRSIDEVE